MLVLFGLPLGGLLLLSMLLSMDAQVVLAQNRTIPPILTIC